MRKIFVSVFTILGGIIGCVLGNLAAGHRIIDFLSLGGQLGFENPIVLNLSFLKITLGFWCNINLGGVLGLVLFAILSQRIARWLKI